MHDIAKDILLIAKVFLAVILGLIVFVAFFGIFQIDLWLYALLFFANVFMSTLIFVTIRIVILLFVELGWKKRKK